MHFVDLHIHSKHSRATSKDLDLENLAKYAKMKGIDVLGTGDFSHLLWNKELKQKLVENEGVYEYNGIKFIPKNKGIQSITVNTVLKNEVHDETNSEKHIN